MLATAPYVVQAWCRAPGHQQQHLTSALLQHHMLGAGSALLCRTTLSHSKSHLDVPTLALLSSPQAQPCCVGCRTTLGNNNGVLKLPLIKNKKTINPRDSSTPAVFQLETAMGSAIECFENAGAVVVPRERFAPVKTTNDLFILRSDCYKVRWAVQGSLSCVM